MLYHACSHTFYSTRDAAAAHEAAQAAQIQTQYQNMGLPPSLVQAARNHQQLTVVQTAQPTPPQTPVSTITWKAAAAPATAAAVIVPEPQKVTDPRAVVNNIRTNERQYSQASC